MKTEAPYGSWQAPITPEFVAGRERQLTEQMQVDGEDIYFIETRPDEAGRSVLMRIRPGGQAEEVLARHFNVRTKYLEYGGQSFFVREGTCYFVNYADQQIYVARKGEEPVQLTHEEGYRFSDFVLDKKRDRLLALTEAPAHPESRNSICSIDLKTGKVDEHGAEGR